MIFKFQVQEIQKADFSRFVSFILEQRKEHDEAVLRRKVHQTLQKLWQLKKIYRRPIIFIAKLADGTIIGYLILHWLWEFWSNSPEALVSSLYVIPARRNQGVATSLLEKATIKIKQFSCARLWLENNRKNPIYDKQFYAKRHWKERKDLAVFEFHDVEN